MPSYDRDYMQDRPRREFQLPSLGRVTRTLLFLIPGCYLVAVVLTDDLIHAGMRALTHPTLGQLALTSHALLPIGGSPSPWQLVTAPFLYGGLIEVILLCVFAVWLVGGLLEKALGWKAYALLLASGALASNLAAALIDPLLAPDAASMGYSGLWGTVVMALGRAIPEGRSFFNLRIITVSWILLGVAGLFAVLSYGRGDALISSLPALAAGAGWGWLFVREYRRRGYRIVSPTAAQRPEDDEPWRASLPAEDRMESEAQRKRREAREQREAEAYRKQREAERAGQDKLDALLDRISEQGIGSLSRKERAFLERVSKEKKRGK